ncbi:hypothetical protein JX265_003561 [Neoarthrinium moseri]|uniref:DUF924-domain-containing protein n=1 Tax=Neoarthrinium moseri TaxID=1658444 RepID=A0A9P9WSC8_9PEZI|nr:hypothetical protein JX265_003561 [Neoarthrinium moseri]
MASLRAFTLNKHLFNPSLYRRITSLWFEGIPKDSTVMSREAGMRWFGAGVDPAAKSAFDNECHNTAREALESIGPKRLGLPDFTSVEKDQVNYLALARPFQDEYNRTGIQRQESTEAALAIVLLLDQFSRNLYRSDQGLVYIHYDRLARAVSQDIRSRGIQHDAEISHVWRFWFYMPLVHSEFLQDHVELERYVQSEMSAAKEVENQARIESLETQLRFGKAHSDLIRRFGRYPHRNKWVGRETTKEEQDFLDNDGETFGSG